MHLLEHVKQVYILAVNVTEDLDRSLELNESFLVLKYAGNSLDKKLNHLDDKRRENYLKRSANIKNKEGKLTRNDPKSPNYHARRVLW